MSASVAAASTALRCGSLKCAGTVITTSSTGWCAMASTSNASFLSSRADTPSGYQAAPLSS